MKATVEATPNIAVVKYWGKRDTRLMLPLNSSISITLDDTLKTRTTVEFSKNFREDELVLNGQKHALKDEQKRQLDIVRKRAKISLNAKIASENFLPTAAGFASSASGMAALAIAASKAAGLDLSSRELSMLARIGSGSACRSVLGGFVEWQAGNNADGLDSFAIQIAQESHWPELRNIITIVDARQKKVPSRTGMQRTVETSKLFKKRIQTIGDTLSGMKTAILKKDFEKFAIITMQESNSLHSVMLDTFPPIIYLSDASKEVMEAIHSLNEENGKIIAAYTFDAGPNAHVFTLQKYENEVKKALQMPEVKETITCKVGSGPKLINTP